jgi:hypothetical protein
MPPPSLLLQTTYAELVERCRAASFQDAFPPNGTFVSKTVKDRKYWYFQSSTAEGREQKYVGPETPALLQEIARHKQLRDDERERRSLVATLIRSFSLPPPVAIIGEVISVLAKAGVFRLRGVLVGTAAYQTYSAMLGTKLPHSILQTNDVDIAQFQNISIAVEDRTPPVLDVLKEVDKTFAPVPHLHKHNVTSYQAKHGIRVDFLTPKMGPDTDAPKRLPALQTDAEPLRFLDFLIQEPEPAVVLHGAGTYVLVPSPQRYAVHKLIVARRRPEGAAKRDKDIQQAASLLAVLADKRSFELKAAWSEAFNRGPSWRSYLVEGLSQLPAGVRDFVLKTIGQTRSIVPGLDLTFDNSPGRYDNERDVVTFDGDALRRPVRCAISREALDDHYGASTKDERLEKFRQNRSVIEQMVRKKYLNWPVEEPESVLLKTLDVPQLQAATAVTSAH